MQSCPGVARGEANWKCERPDEIRNDDHTTSLA
jgi:hypothetical protein